MTPGAPPLSTVGPAGTAPVPFHWGRTVVDGAYEGHPGRLWEPRRHLVPELLLDAARWSDREFLVQGSRRISFDDHDRAASTIAARLRRLGAGPGTRVMIAAGNHPETIATWWGVLMAGATVVMANAWWSAAELAAAVDDIGPVLLVVDESCAVRAPGGIPLLRLESLGDAFDAAGRSGPGDTPEPPGRPAVGAEDDPAVILFTSGTTGAPKGVVLSHRAVIANVHTLLAAGGRLPQDLPDDAPADVHLELRIADPDDDGLGEVIVRSPTVMSGYWNRPGESPVDAGGWLRTGDLGRIEDGELLLLGRSKDVIIRAGENVAAAHVESCLVRHPAVEQVAVVGLADPELGEEVGAVVVLRAGHDLTEGELERFAAGDLAHFEVPTAWWLRHEPLPETASGKVEKARLVSDWRGSRKRTAVSAQGSTRRQWWP